nr:hypothetical protein CFP56_41850 [Quercus suber]
MGSDNIQSMILWSPKSEPEEEPVLKQNFVSVTYVDLNVAHCPSLDSQSLFQLLPEIRGLPPSLPHSSTMPPIWQNHLCEYSFESSLQELFRDLQLTDRNHVEILCETFIPSFAPRENIAPIVERIGVHVECNCPPPQNLNIFQDINRQLSLQSGLGLPMHTENGSDLAPSHILFEIIVA